MNTVKTKTIKTVIENQLWYEIHVPRVYNPPYPLIVYLHASGNVGKMVTDGFINLVPDTVKNNSVILEPMCDEGIWCPHSINGLIEDTIRQYAAIIDTNRVYIVGHSMGARGVWDTLLRYPKSFASAIAVSGTGCYLLANSENQNIPVLIVHGEFDRVVDKNESYKMEAVMKKSKFFLLPRDHNIGHTVFSNEKIWEWVLKHKKD